MMRFMKKFLCFSVFLSQVLLPMQQQPVRHVDQAEIDQAVAGAQETINRIPQILQDVEQHERERRQAEADRQRAAMIDQNTLIWGTPAYERRVWQGTGIYEWQNGRLQEDGEYVNVPGLRFGLFKRDLITGGLFFANVATEIAMYKMIKHFRVQRIKEYMLEHRQEVENLLTHIKDELLKIDYQVEDKKITEKEAAEQKKKLMGLIKKFADTEHTLQNAFFNKEIIATILGRLVIAKITDSLEQNLIEHHWVPPFLQRSFEYNEAGERVPCQGQVVSVFTCLRVLHAVLFSQGEVLNILADDLVNMAGDGLETANTWLGLGIPQFVFNPKVKVATRFAVQVISLAWAAKKFDARCQADWITHLEKNHAQLLVIMQEYKSLANSATPEDIKKLKAVENKLEAFIQEGHTSSSWIPGADYRSWFQSKAESNAHIDWFKTLAVTGLLVVKGIQMYRAFSARPNRGQVANATV